MLKNFDCLKLVNFVEKLPEFQKFIQPRRKLLIAFSGGQDSTALLTIFYILSKKWCFKLAVVYCYHGWSNKNQSIGALFPIVMKYKLPLYIVERFSCDFDQSENEARKWRYASFEQVRKIAKYDVILTGHTLSDRVETVLFNLCRGSGLKGMGGLKRLFLPFQIVTNGLPAQKQRQKTRQQGSEGPFGPVQKQGTTVASIRSGPKGGLHMCFAPSEQNLGYKPSEKVNASLGYKPRVAYPWSLGSEGLRHNQTKQQHYVFHYQSMPMKEDRAFISFLSHKKEGILSFEIDFLNQYLCYKYEQQVKWISKASHTQKLFDPDQSYDTPNIASIQTLHMCKGRGSALGSEGFAHVQSSGYRRSGHFRKPCLTDISIITFFHPTVYFSSYSYLKNLIFFTGWLNSKHRFKNNRNSNANKSEHQKRNHHKKRNKITNIFVSRRFDFSLDNFLLKHWCGSMLSFAHVFCPLEERAKFGVQTFGKSECSFGVQSYPCKPSERQKTKAKTRSQGSKGGGSWILQKLDCCYLASKNSMQPANNTSGLFQAKLTKLLIKKLNEKQTFLFFNGKLMKLKQKNCLFSKKFVFVGWGEIKLTKFCVTFSRNCYMKPTLNLKSTLNGFCNNWYQSKHPCIKVTSQIPNQNKDLNTLYVLRPLLPVRRLIITQFIQHVDLSISIDKSNQDLTISRNYMRNKIIPLLKFINPQCEQNIYKFSQIASFYFETHPNKNQMCPPSLLVYFM